MPAWFWQLWQNIWRHEVPFLACERHATAGSNASAPNLHHWRGNWSCASSFELAARSPKQSLPVFSKPHRLSEQMVGASSLRLSVWLFVCSGAGQHAAAHQALWQCCCCMKGKPRWPPLPKPWLWAWVSPGAPPPRCFHGSSAQTPSRRS